MEAPQRPQGIFLSSRECEGRGRRATMMSEMLGLKKVDSQPKAKPFPAASPH